MKSSELKKIVGNLLEQGIGTKDAYRQAVPLVFEMEKAITDTKEWLAILKDSHDRLSEGAASYAIDHATALDEPLSADKDGIESGTVEIEGETYRLTLSKDAPTRISGGNFTQGFLADLPKNLTAQKLTLKTSALEGMSPDELARYDLKRDVKRVWSIPDRA